MPRMIEYGKTKNHYQRMRHTYRERRRIWKIRLKEGRDPNEVKPIIQRLTNRIAVINRTIRRKAEVDRKLEKLVQLTTDYFNIPPYEGSKSNQKALLSRRFYSKYAVEKICTGHMAASYIGKRRETCTEDRLRVIEKMKVDPELAKKWVHFREYIKEGWDL